MCSLPQDHLVDVLLALNVMILVVGTAAVQVLESVTASLVVERAARELMVCLIEGILAVARMIQRGALLKEWAIVLIPAIGLPIVVSALVSKFHHIRTI